MLGGGVGAPSNLKPMLGACILVALSSKFSSFLLNAPIFFIPLENLLGIDFSPKVYLPAVCIALSANFNFEYVAAALLANDFIVPALDSCPNIFLIISSPLNKKVIPTIIKIKSYSSPVEVPTTVVGSVPSLVEPLINLFPVVNVPEDAYTVAQTKTYTIAWNVCTKTFIIYSFSHVFKACDFPSAILSIA